MKDNKEFWDEVVSIESIGEKFVAVINAGDTAFWAGEQDGSYILHHNVELQSLDDRFFSKGGVSDFNGGDFNSNLNQQV